jgi:MFS family permease
VPEADSEALMTLNPAASPGDSPDTAAGESRVVVAGDSVGTAPGEPPATEGGAASRGALTAAMGLCVSLVVGTVSAVNLAIPSLAAGSPHPSAEGVLWVVDGYVAVFACLLIPAGALADRIGRKGTLLAGLGIFTAGALVCALAPGTGVLIAGRMVSGVGAAAVLPNTLALLTEGLGGRPRRRAIAVWASMTGLAAVAGNVGGGAAIQFGTWRTLFAATVPLVLVALVLTAVVAPAPAPHPRPVPLVSTAQLTFGVLAALYAIVSGPEQGWTSPAFVLAALIAPLVLGSWAWRERRLPHPLLDPGVLALRAVRAGALGMAVLFLGMFGLFYVNGQYMQYAKGYGAFEAGLRLLPMAGALLAGPRAALLLHHLTNARTTVATGMLVMACGLGTLGTVSADSPYLLYAAGAALTALGCGIATPLLSHAIMSPLPPERAGIGSGLQSLARELGSALGIAVTGSLVTSTFTAALPASLTTGGRPPSTPAAALSAPNASGLHQEIVGAFTHAVDVAMPTLAVLVAASAVVVALRLPKDG